MPPELSSRPLGDRPVPALRLLDLSRELTPPADPGIVSAPEIAAPLTPIRYAVHLLKLVEDDLPAGAQTALGILERQVCELVRVSDRLSAAESPGRPRVGRAELGGIVRGLAGAAGVELMDGSATDPVFVECSPAVAEQAVALLFDQAVNAAPGAVVAALAVGCGAAELRVGTAGGAEYACRLPLAESD